MTAQSFGLPNAQQEPRRARTLLLDGHSKACAQAVLSLRDSCVVHVAAEAPGCLSFASHRVAHRHVQPADASALAIWLTELDAIYAFDLIIPCTEASLMVLKSEQLQGSLRSKAALAPEAAIDIALNKSATNSLARSLGIAVPAERLVNNPTEAGPFGGAPTIIKPLFSKVRADGQLRALAVHVCATEAERDAALRAILPYTSALEQEYFRGRGVGVEALFEHGQPRWMFAHERLHELPVTGGASTYRRNVVPMPAVAEAAIKLLQHLRWHGVAMVEFKIASNGDYRLLEINPRLWGSLPLADACGVNFPVGLLRLAMGEPIGPQPLTPQVRYMRDAAADLLWFVRSWRHRRNPLLVKPLDWRDVAALLRPLTGAEHWDLFRWREPALWWRLTTQTLAQVTGPQFSRLVGLRQTRRAIRAARRQWRALAPAWRDGQQQRVLILCHGNICRSPLAERLLVGANLPGVSVASAGFDNRTLRTSPADWMAAARAVCNLTLDEHRSRTIDRVMADWADLIIVMDEANWQRLAERFPNALIKATLLPIAGAAPRRDRQTLPDPYGLADARQRAIAHQIGEYVNRLVQQRLVAAKKTSAAANVRS